MKFYFHKKVNQKETDQEIKQDKVCGVNLKDRIDLRQWIKTELKTFTKIL